MSAGARRASRASESHDQQNLRDDSRERLLRQRVDALAFGLRGDGESLVEIWWNAEIELPGIMPARLNAFLSAHLQENPKRLCEFRTQRARAASVKARSPVQPQNLTSKRSSSGSYSIFAPYPSRVMLFMAPPRVVPTIAECCSPPPCPAPSPDDIGETPALRQCRTGGQ